MKIIAKGDDYNVRLRIPTDLVFNRFTAAAISISVYCPAAAL